MADKTNIAWTERTWNPWRRAGWKFEQVTRCGEDIWKRPDKWQREAAAAKTVDPVFTCSISDFFHPAADPWRTEAWDIIRRTPNLAWQILTKALVTEGQGLDHILSRLPDDWGNKGWRHVWIGASAGRPETFKATMKQLPLIPAAIQFLSMEPLLERITMADFRAVDDQLHQLDQAIIGGESGNHLADQKWKNRIMDLNWARLAAREFLRRDVAVMFKQRSAVKPEQPAGDPWLDGLKQFPAAFSVHLTAARVDGNLAEDPQRQLFE